MNYAIKQPQKATHGILLTGTPQVSLAQKWWPF